MKKRTFIAMLTVVMMIFTLVPAASFAASRETKAEDIVEEFEYVYMDNIKDKSKYCDAVWAEIQEVYTEGRAYYVNTTWEEEFGDYYYDEEDEEDFLAYEPEEIDYMNLLAMLGQLTWVKSEADLQTAKAKYLKEINTAYKTYDKADFNDYNWDMIQDCLYVGKNQLNAATTFRDAASGYYYAMMGMWCATDNDTIKEYRKYMQDQLKQFVYLYLDPAKYSEPAWASIEALYKEAVEALGEAQTEGEMTRVVDEYGEKLSALTGKDYPLSEDEFYNMIDSLMKEPMEFYEEMDQAQYSLENLWIAEGIIWTLEWDLEEVTTRDAANKLVNKAMEQLKAIMTKDEQNALLASYVPKVKAKGKTASSIQISWPANEKMDGYVVYRSTAKNGTYKAVKTVYLPSKTCTVTDTKLTFGKNYFYKVKGFISIDGKTRYTKANAPVKATPKLCAPSLTLSKVGSKDVQLKWKKVTGAKGYEIYRSNSVNGAFKKVKTVKSGDTIKWKDTSTKKGKTYCYKMRSYTTKANGTKKYSGYTAIKTIKR